MQIEQWQEGEDYEQGGHRQGLAKVYSAGGWGITILIYKVYAAIFNIKCYILNTY